MHVMFEVVLAPGALGEGLISQETLKDTQAQVMTREEAEQVGFQGIPDDPHGRDRRFVVVAKRDERRIMNQLEANPEVAGFQPHYVDI